MGVVTGVMVEREAAMPAADDDDVVEVHEEAGAQVADEDAQEAATAAAVDCPQMAEEEAQETATAAALD